MWVIADVLLAAGIAACVTFAVLPYVRKNKNTDNTVGSGGKE